MPIVNNVTRMLDARKVEYEARELPAEKLGAQEAAQFMGVPEGEVFKTIVVTREDPAAGGKMRRPVLAVVAGPGTVDLKLLAGVLGEKRMYLPPERVAEQLTGLQAGGISALALIHKGFQVVIDSGAQDLEWIYVSGGQRGLNIRLRVRDLAELTQARFGRIAREG